MTPAELKTLLDNIVTEVNGAADFAGALDPAIIPFIAIGKAVDKLIPGLAESVDNWIQGNPPTDAEKAELAQQLSVLGNPDLP
jgi:hypothetical protein